MFQERDLQLAFFQLIDRDCNGSLCQEEWTGCFSKLLGESDIHIMNWFVDKFNSYCSISQKFYLTRQDFASIVADVEFGYRVASVISPKSRRVNILQLLTSLEIISSMSTDTKWLSWLKYQFTDAMVKSNRCDKSELYVTLNDFTENFYFKEPFLASRLFNFLDKIKQVLLHCVNSLMV